MTQIGRTILKSLASLPGPEKGSFEINSPNKKSGLAEVPRDTSLHGNASFYIIDCQNRPSWSSLSTTTESERDHKKKGKTNGSRIRGPSERGAVDRIMVTFTVSTPDCN